MKKAFITLFAVVATATGLYAQDKAKNDTMVVKATSIKWETEVLVSQKTGKSRTDYYATIDGVTYPTNKTSMQRYATIKRFGGEPCVALINKKRVVTL